MRPSAEVHVSAVAKIDERSLLKSHIYPEAERHEANERKKERKKEKGQGSRQIYYNKALGEGLYEMYREGIKLISMSIGRFARASIDRYLREYAQAITST